MKRALLLLTAIAACHSSPAAPAAKFAASVWVANMSAGALDLAAPNATWPIAAPGATGCIRVPVDSSIHLALVSGADTLWGETIVTNQVAGGLVILAFDVTVSPTDSVTAVVGNAATHTC